MEYIAKLDCADVPDYGKCRKIFNDGLKTLKIPNTGDLDFKLKNVGKRIKSHGRKADEAKDVNTSEEVIEDSNSDDDFSIEKPKISNKRILPTKAIYSPTKKLKIATGPAVDIRREIIPSVSPPKKASPKRKTPVKRLPPKEKARTENGHSSESVTPSPRQRKDRTPLTAKTYININPAIRVGRSSPMESKTPKKLGKTTLNTNLTPPIPTRTGNKYEFNIELDVSMDADVKVNVKRKQKTEKPVASKEKTKTKADKINQSSDDIEEIVSPITRSKIRKVDNEANVRIGKVPRSKRK